MEICKLILHLGNKGPVPTKDNILTLTILLYLKFVPAHMKVWRENSLNRNKSLKTPVLPTEKLKFNFFDLLLYQNFSARTILGK